MAGSRKNSPAQLPNDLPNIDLPPQPIIFGPIQPINIGNLQLPPIVVAPIQLQPLPIPDYIGAVTAALKSDSEQH
ncbi:MAG UNVERIFIED_CONTAM: hypothetical protein LVQ98_08025 [Rickettsiaceae bacterium]